MAKKGLEIIIGELSSYECPSWHGLEDVERVEGEDNICIYGANANEKCIECWKKSLEKDYYVKNPFSSQC